MRWWRVPITHCINQFFVWWVVLLPLFFGWIECLSGGGRSYSRFAKRNISHRRYIAYEVYIARSISHPKGIKGSSLTTFLLLYKRIIIIYTENPNRVHRCNFLSSFRSTRSKFPKYHRLKTRSDICQNWGRGSFL